MSNKFHLLLNDDELLNDLKKLITNINDFSISRKVKTDSQFINNLNINLGQLMSIECCKFFLNLHFPINWTCFSQVCCFRKNDITPLQKEFIEWYLTNLLPVSKYQEIDKELCFDINIPKIIFNSSQSEGYITIKNFEIIKLLTTDEYHKVFFVKTEDGKYKVLKCMIEYENYIYSKLMKNPHKNLANFEEQYYCFEHSTLTTNYVNKMTQFEYYDYTFSSIDFTSLPLNTKYKIIEELINGVTHLHTLGYYHGDLKPANICITNSFEVKIIDFETCNEYTVLTEEKNTFPFITPYSYFYRLSNSSLFKDKYNSDYKESGVKNDIYVVALLILYILSGIKKLYFNFELTDEEKIKYEEMNCEEDKEDFLNDIMMEQIDLSDGKLWFKIYKTDLITEQQILLLENCLQSSEEKRASNLLYKLKNAFK